MAKNLISVIPKKCKENASVRASFPFFKKWIRHNDISTAGESFFSYSCFLFWQQPLLSLRVFLNGEAISELERKLKIIFLLWILMILMIFPRWLNLRFFELLMKCPHTKVFQIRYILFWLKQNWSFLFYGKKEKL